MFGNDNVSLTERRRNAMRDILEHATKSVAQKVVDGDLTREDAEKVHVYAIAALGSGMPGASAEKGAAAERRATVSEYLESFIQELSDKAES